MMKRLLLCCLAILTHACPGARAVQPDAPAQPIDFNRDIRPILSDNCFQCHGPDKANRKGKLGRDTEEWALTDRGGYQAVTPGKAADSELIRRITAKGKDRMPPPASAHALTTAQMDLLRRWIDEGAKWQKHWSLIPPRRPALPAVRNPGWCRNPIDHFVLARLEQAGLAPSPE